MHSSERVRTGLGSAISGPGGALESADRLCHACVDLLDVDGASISFVDQGASRGTFGSSSELSRRLDEFQLTFGEGPCLDAVRLGVPVLAPDLADPEEQRRPAFSQAVLKSGVRAVCARQVAVAASGVGALDLFRLSTGPFSDDDLSGEVRATQATVGGGNQQKSRTGEIRHLSGRQDLRRSAGICNRGKHQDQCSRSPEQEQSPK